MPNYIITTKANFKPFSYAELLAPVASATKAHRELEDAYSDLDTKASVWERLANSPQDKDVYDIYKKYSNDLNQAADSLAKEGLTPTSRRELSKLKARYSSDIIPIEDAYNRREQDRTNYKQALMKDPTLMSSSNPNIASLSAYMGGKQPTYHNVSGDDLYKRGAAASKASSLRRYSGTNIGHALGAQYWKLTKTQGYSPTEAALFLADTNNIPELSEAINRISREYGIDALEDREKAVDYIISGIMDGMVYKEEDDYKKDENFISSYQREVLNRKGDKDNNESPKYSYSLDTRISDVTKNNAVKDAAEILNYTEKDFEELFDNEGHIRKATLVKTDSIYGMPLEAYNPDIDAKTYKLSKVLSDSGYDPNKMNKTEILSALKAISEGKMSSGISQNWLRIDLSSEASKDIRERTVNDSFYKVDSFNSKGSMPGQLGKINIPQNESNTIFIDIEAENPGIYLENSTGIYDISKKLTKYELDDYYYLSKKLETDKGTLIRLQTELNKLGSKLFNEDGSIKEGSSTIDIYNYNTLYNQYNIVNNNLRSIYQAAHDLVRNSIAKHYSTINETN